MTGVMRVLAFEAKTSNYKTQAFAVSASESDVFFRTSK
jgi:hypothetical protein